MDQRNSRHTATVPLFFWLFLSVAVFGVSDGVCVHYLLINETVVIPLRSHSSSGCFCLSRSIAVSEVSGSVVVSVYVMSINETVVTAVRFLFF